MANVKITLSHKEIQEAIQEYIFKNNENVDIDPEDLTLLLTKNYDYFEIDVYYKVEIK